MDEDTMLGGIAFVGDALAPLFLNDPVKGAAGASFAAFAALDVDAAAAEWPFVDDEAARDALGDMQRALVDAGGAPDDDMMWEYRRLFVGPAPKAAPPWGSVYTDRECVVFGEATLDLRQWMRESGVTRLGEEKDPEDHIGLMLAMMAWLADHRPEKLDEFLRLHFLTWADHFLGIMEDATSHPFYNGLARLTRASLEGIRAARGLEIDYPRFYR